MEALRAQLLEAERTAAAAGNYERASELCALEVRLGEAAAAHDTGDDVSAALAATAAEARDSLKHKRTLPRGMTRYMVAPPTGATMAAAAHTPAGAGGWCRCFAGKRAPTAEEERAAALQRESDEQWARIVELERENRRLSMSAGA